MAELEMLKILQAQILGHAFQAFKDNIEITRLTGIKHKQFNRKEAQKEIFRIALKKGKSAMQKVLEERLSAIRAKTKETEMFDSIGEIIRDTCNTHADAYFEAYETSEMKEIETIWKLETELKELDDHVEFLKKSEAELNQPGISEKRRNIVKKRIKKELEERNNKFKNDEQMESPSESVMEKFAEELERFAVKEDRKVHELSPALKAMVEEMNNSFTPHEYVYPPPPEPGTIRVPTGGLAKCCCSDDCQEELMEPAYVVLGKKPEDERWRLDDNDANKRGPQSRKKKKK